MAGFGQLLGALILERREAGGFTQIELAEEAFPDLKDHDGKERRIRELELGEVTRPQARNYQPICDVLSISRAEIRELKAKAADSSEQQDAEISEVVQEKGSVDAALSDASSLTRDQLELLASRFEIEAPHALSDDKLQNLLTQKAEEYRSYRNQIDALDDRIAGVHNLKAAAQDAAERLDFDEVEELLACVDMVETEIMAETKEARASNALLRGRVDQAYNIFTAAADSFRELDILEMAKRRDRYRSQLFNNGLRYGGTALSRAIDIQRPGIDALKDTEHREDWAAFTQNLANALANQGARTEGEAGIKLLAEAVTAFRDALTVRTRKDHSMDWAMTTQNLAGALQSQGMRTEGKLGNALLAEAVAAYRDVLTVFTRKDHPAYWAATTQNLASVLRNQGSLTKGEAGTALLAETVTAYRAALTVYTREDHPVYWATVTQNLAIALKDQGNRTKGEQGAALLAEAIAACRDALTVRTREDQPAQWAMTQANLAVTELGRADHPATKYPAPHLKSALKYVEAALTVYEPENMSYDYGTASDLRDEIQARIDALKDD